MQRFDDWLADPPRNMLDASLRSGLEIASRVYSAGVEARNWAYRNGVFRRISVNAPVVSIGNVTVGGTGKTPLAIYLARMLQADSHQPVVVSRGYLKRGHGLVVVSDTESVLAGRRRSGDEAHLMAKRLPGVPVVVGPNRAFASLVAVTRFDPDVVLMDDAFQHLVVERDLDLVVIDATNPFGNGRVLPGGLLREPPKSLVRADVIVLTRVDQAEDVPQLRERLHDLNDHAPVVQSVHQPTRLCRLSSDEAMELSTLASCSVAALSGIGNPGAFESTLRSLGADLKARWRFPNHHYYRMARLSELVDDAKKLGVDAIVTTEKDAVRFPPGFVFDVPVWVLGIDLKVVAGEKHLDRIRSLAAGDQM